MSSKESSASKHINAINRVRRYQAAERKKAQAETLYNLKQRPEELNDLPQLDTTDELPAKRARQNASFDDMPDLEPVQENDPEEQACGILETIEKELSGDGVPIVKQEQSQPAAQVESDDAMNFEDFILNNEAEADMDVEECRTVTNEILNQDDEDVKYLGKLKFSEGMLNFSDKLYEEVKEEKEDDEYDDSRDTCHGCNRDCSHVKGMVCCEEKFCSKGGWWCTECQPEFNKQTKKFEQKSKLAFSYKPTTENGKLTKNEVLNNLVARLPWACDSCSIHESYAKKYAIWEKHWRRKARNKTTFASLELNHQRL